MHLLDAPAELPFTAFQPGCMTNISLGISCKLFITFVPCIVSTFSVLEREFLRSCISCTESANLSKIKFVSFFKVCIFKYDYGGV